ncbi:MAG: HIT domain-containing protein, partial [Candidatus Aenigmarchaeota archaeon]|nr:HIT domain-containing protein [Candidatus Aenigmarchaeota archaeon]
MSDINVESLSSQLGQQTMATPQAEPKKECVFCAIVNGAMPAKIVADNEYFIAFLDIQPKAAGHIVIVPKRHAL